MLTKYEVRWNFMALKILSLLNVCPFDVDYKTGQLKRQENLWRRRIWKILFYSTIFYELFFLERLLQALMEPKIQISQVCVLSVFVIGFGLNIYMAKVLFVSWPYLSIKVFNELYYTKKPIKVKFRWMSYSLQELITIFLFLVPFGPIPLHAYLYYQEPNKIIYLYSLLSPEWQTLTVFWIVMVMEVFLMVNMTPAFMLGIFVMLSTFQKVLWAAEIEEVSLGMPRKLNGHRVRAAYMLCRRLQLTTHLFNLVYASINWAIKVTAISICIGGAFFTIHWFDEYRFASIISGIMVFEAVMMFKVIYDRAFRFPDQFEELKDKIVVVSNRLLFGSYHTKKRIQSIPNLSIMVGEFNALERNSTLIFVDFVARNAAGLLVSF